MSAAYNDGSVPYGSRVLTIASIAYVAESIEVKRPTMKIERRNELNEPSGKVVISDFDSGTATLQLASSSTAIPQRGATFVTTFEANSETFYITEVGQPEAQGADKKVSISFDKKYSA